MSEILVVRDGAAVRNSVELVQCFLLDARDVIAVRGSSEQVERVEAIIENSLEYDLEDIDDRAGLEFSADHVERVLFEVDCVVDWEDGFIIRTVDAE